MVGNPPRRRRKSCSILIERSEVTSKDLSNVQQKTNGVTNIVVVDSAADSGCELSVLESKLFYEVWVVDICSS
jgi:hypothetical protein